MSDINFGDEYYQEVIRQRKCGPYSFGEFDFGLGLMSKQDLQRLWLCHVNGDSFRSAIEKNSRVIATTGFGLTGVPHVGSIAQILRAIRLQQSGIPVQVVLGDLDAYNGKAVNLSRIFKLVPQYREFIKNLGFDDSPPSILRTQFDALSTLRTLYLTGNYLSDEMFEMAKEDIHDYYSKHGKIDNSMTYRIKLSLNLMVADFLDLHVQQNFKSVMVFLGIDEYKYCGLAMDVLNKIQAQSDLFSGFSLAGMFSLTMKGFYDYPKMGKSFLDSGVDVTMPEYDVRERIINGETTFSKPEDSVVYQMISTASLYSPREIEAAYEACLIGGSKWESIKEDYANHLWDILSKWKDID